MNRLFLFRKASAGGFEQLEEFRGINLDNEASASLNRLVGGLSNNEEDYKLFTMSIRMAG